MAFTIEELRQELERREALKAEARRRGIDVSGEETTEEPEDQGYFEEGDTGDWLLGVAQAAGQGLTFGFGDEIVGAGMALFGDEEEGTFKQRYIKNRNMLREAQDEFARENPGSAAVAEITGSFATPVGIIGGLGRGAYTMSKVVTGTRAAMTGMAGGALYGLGDSDKDIDDVRGILGDVAEGAAIGAVGGLGAQKLVKGGARLTKMGQKAYYRVFNKPAYKAMTTKPTIETLETAAQKAYAKVDDLGIQYKPEYTDGMIGKMAREIQEAGAHPTGDPKTFEVLDGLINWRHNKAANVNDNFLTVSDIDKMRQYVYRELMKEKSGSGRYYGSKMLEALDGLMDDAALKGGGLTGDLTKASSAIEKARKAYARLRKAELIDDAMTRATYDAAKTGSGGNINNRMRQELDKILNSKRHSKYFTAEEKAALMAAVKGTNTANLLRLVGKLAPSGNGLMLALNLIGAGINPMVLAGTGASMAAKKLGERATKAAADRARNVVTRGFLEGATPVGTQRAAGALGTALAPARRHARTLGKNLTEYGYNVGTNEGGRNIVTGE